LNRHFIDYNAAAAHYVAMTADQAKTPSQIAAELEEQRKKAQAEDAKGYATMTPPAGAKPREAPYQPEGFGYAHVDHRGHQGDVIPQREAAKMPPTPKDREQAAFEAWGDKTRPSGDAESVQCQWMRSAERAELFEAEEAPAKPTYWDCCAAASAAVRRGVSVEARADLCRRLGLSPKQPMSVMAPELARAYIDGMNSLT
jgi:hypothetical protein